MSRCRPDGRGCRPPIARAIANGSGGAASPATAGTVTRAPVADLAAAVDR